MLVSRIYHVKPATIAAISGWGVILLALLIPFALETPTRDGMLLLCGLGILCALQIAFLATQRLEFQPDRFVFQRWGRKFEVRYTDIAMIERVNRPRAYWSVRLTTSDERSLEFLIDFFPDEARTQLMQIYRDFSRH